MMMNASVLMPMQLWDPCTVMFFFRNKHIMIDLGTGNNNKVSQQRCVNLD